MGWYQEGTLSVTQNSTSVTGASTRWVSNVRVGEALLAPDGRFYEVTSIASDGAMSIAPAYKGATAAAQAYAIVPIQGYVKRLADQAARVLNGITLDLSDKADKSELPTAVRSALLDGIVFNVTSAVVAGDSVLQALGKLQAQASNKVDKVTGKALSSNDFTNTERVKLTNIAEHATKNAADADLRDRSTHTGTQAISTVSGLEAALNGKETPAGALAQIRAFGLGVQSLPATLVNIDASETASGFYRVVPSTTGAKPTGAPTNGVVQVIRFNDLDCRQVFYGIGGSEAGKKVWVRHIAWNGTTSLPTQWIELAAGESPVFSGAVTVGSSTQQPAYSLSVGLSSGKTWTSNTNIRFQVESSGISGINVISGNAAQGRIWFSDVDAEQRGRILYEHVDDSLLLQTSGGGVKMPDAYSKTTASAANVYVDSVGLLQRSTSSAKYKTQVEPADAALMQRIIDDAEPVWYRSLCEADPVEHSYWGLLAESLAEIDPRFVHWAYPNKTVEHTEQVEVGRDENDQPIYETQTYTEQVPDTDAPLQAEGVQYERLVVPLLWHAKKMQARFDALEQRLAALEAANG